MTVDDAALGAILGALGAVRDRLINAEIDGANDDEAIYWARQRLEQIIGDLRAAADLPPRSSPRLVWPPPTCDDDVPF